MDARIARLKAFVDDQTAAGKIQRATAADLGVSQPTLSRVLNERDDVTRDLAFAIERATKDWAGGQILAAEWEEYKPARGRGARGAAADGGEIDDDKSSSDSGEHAATEPDPAAAIKAAGSAA